MKQLAWIPLLAAALTGCAGPKYACQVPEGGACMSVAEVYRSETGGVGSPQAAPTPILAQPESARLPQYRPGTPIRTEPRILRVWMAPWEDQNGNFHDQSYTYVVADTGKWLLRQNRMLLEQANRFANLAAPAEAAADPQAREPENAGRPDAEAEAQKTIAGSTQAMEQAPTASTGGQ